MTDDLLGYFLVEGRELAAQAGEDLEALSRTPNDRARLDSCFRAIHTLKGSVGLFDLPAMARLLHAAEDQLSALRSGSAITAEGLYVLVEVADQIDRWLDSLEHDGALPGDATEASRALIARLTGKEAGDEVDKRPVAIRYVPRPDAYFVGDDPIAIMASVPGLEALAVSLCEQPQRLDDYDPFQCNLLIQATSSAPMREVEAALRWVKDQVELSYASDEQDQAIESGGREGTGGRTIRVEVSRVDRLANLASDLLIAKNGFSPLLAQVDRLEGGQALGPALRAQQARLDRLVSDLHGAVGKVRLTPLAPLFGRLPRLVRETARSLGKSIDFTCLGGDVEVDKDIVDGLFDPLLHVLRNAMDHGVEGADIRRSLGKPEKGGVRLVARTDGDKVVLEVIDDGAGVDAAKVRSLAIARGLVDEATAESLDDREALDLIFLPGFSTAREVSEISGRGVGMDAVRAAVSGLGGRVEVDSVLGAGSTVRLVLPISMVLARVLIVACGEERYGLPLTEVRETARVAPEQIVPVRDGEAFQLRDQVTPLVSLRSLVGLQPVADLGTSRRVVVAEVDGEPVGLSVDAIVGRMDVSVRPLTGLLAQAPGVAGSAILDDGAVLIILDLAELIAWG
ncbi:chemotaxis protein CheA [Caulobacter segnis]|uniref:Chemotaxis protein CheA n=1 Tax=Caulobacter segnis TaxID=88688 RepID=A0A2W5VAM6_9CAUL|nr:chemotaxis protein CheA [Caulobacter segnis]PZR34883.1 MAG: chemotaxis protein CheA [Caulobacter segnis]